MILFYITSISDLMIDTLLEQAILGDVFVATPRHEVYNLVNSWGLDCLLMRSDIAPSRREADRDFQKHFMPGIFGNDVFPTTDLPLWQVLSLDRLKFWQQPNFRLEVDFLRSLRFSSAYVSLDMGNAIPFALASFIDTTAVRTEPLRTREVLDAVPHLPFVQYVVDDAHGAKFLVRAGVHGAVELVPGPEPEEPVAFKNLLATSEDVIGILFDKRYERQSRLLCSVLDYAGWPEVYVFPVDERAAQLIPASLGDYLDRVHIVADPKVLGSCDEIVAFGYDGNYCRNLPSKLVLYDPHGLNKAAIIAPEYENRGLPA